MWRWQGGTAAADQIWGSTAAPQPANTYHSMIFAGYTSGLWKKSRNPPGSSDFAVVALSAVDRSEVWHWRDGTPGDSRFEGVRYHKTPGYTNDVGACAGRLISSAFFTTQRMP